MNPTHRFGRFLAEVGAVFALVSSGVVFASPAARADCAPLDLTCQADGASNAVSDPVGTVTGAVNGAKDTGDQVVGGAKDAAGTVVDRATSTVGGVAGGGGTDPGSGPGSDGGHATRRATAGPDLSAGSRHAARTAAARRTFSSATSGSAVTNPASGGVTTASSEPTAVDVGGTSGLAGAIGRVAKRLAFPLALLVLVLAFIVFQHRIDRRDGKLAEAPVGRDVASFS